MAEAMPALIRRREDARAYILRGYSSLGSGLIGTGTAVPPDLGIGRGIEHFRQFLLDFAEAVSAQLKSRLIHGCGIGLLRALGVQVAQIGDFLAKAGEVFRKAGHVFIIRRLRGSADICLAAECGIQSRNRPIFRSAGSNVGPLAADHADDRRKNQPQRTLRSQRRQGRDCRAYIY